MPGNPFGAEIDVLTTEVFRLNTEISSASGLANKELEKERSAKLQALAKLDEMSESWRLGKLSTAVKALKSLAESELAKQAKITQRLKRILQDLGVSSANDGQEEQEPQSGPKSSGVIEATSGPAASDYRLIEVDSRAFDALSRVAQSEVGHFAKYGSDQLDGGVSAVVETIFNRVAHKGFPSEIETVIDQRFQFSAINTLGTWELLPAAKLNIQNIVRDYLDGRVNGRKGVLGGATHFLNPHLSSANSLIQWGNHVVSNAVAIFGNDTKKDVHYHGFAPGTPLPGRYRISFGGESPVFDGRGTPNDSVRAFGLRTSIVRTLETELAFFDNGKLKEADAAVWERVGTFWSALGLPYHGRSKVTLKNGKVVNPAWSAAFISWTIAEQDIGAGRFRGAQAHWRYVADLFEGRFDDPLFEVKDPNSYAPQPGDLVHYGREWASQFDLVAAKEHVQIDGFYPSHSDFVVEVNEAKDEILTVGGNVGNSVGKKRYKTNKVGTLLPREKNGNENPWIAVLRLRD